MKKIILEKVINLVREQLAAGAGAPTNNVGSGHIAGTVEAGDSPPVSKKKQKKQILYRKKSLIFQMRISSLIKLKILNLGVWN